MENQDVQVTTCEVPILRLVVKRGLVEKGMVKIPTLSHLLQSACLFAYFKVCFLSTDEATILVPPHFWQMP
jgi:hypothetical protein